MTFADRAKKVVENSRYSIDDLQQGIRYPRRAISEINQLYNHSRVGESYNPAGTDVFGHDWDNLFILDACRYDAFVQCSTLPGTTQHRISRGSTSSEFIRGNYSDKSLHDVVYVSANGWFLKLEDEIDAEIHAFEFVERDAVSGRTSRPETVAAAARSAAETYPDKRLVVHFMQPHFPYLGATGREITDYGGRLDEAVQKSGLGRSAVVQAYRENLNLALAEVGPLLSDLGGKSVVTADHGELLWDRQRPIPIRTYGHPEGIYIEPLVKVPWHVHTTGSRREVVAEKPPTVASESEYKAVEQHLRDLGYRT